jgi:hypothetical protein
VNQRPRVHCLMKKTEGQISRDTVSFNAALQYLRPVRMPDRPNECGRTEINQFMASYTHWIFMVNYWYYTKRITKKNWKSYHNKNEYGNGMNLNRNTHVLLAKSLWNISKILPHIEPWNMMVFFIYILKAPFSDYVW